MQKCSLEQSWFLCLDLQVSFLKIMQLETKFSFIRFLSVLIAVSAEH